MTKREVKLCKAILSALHDLDGGQFNEIQIHAEVNLITGETVGFAELKAALAICDTRQWVTRLKSKFTGDLFNINDLGESARLELR